TGPGGFRARITTHMNVLNHAEYDVFVARNSRPLDPFSTQKSSKSGHKTSIPPGRPVSAGGCSSCSLSHMETHKWLQRVALFVALLLAAAPAQAHRLDRVRVASDSLRLLISSGMHRSVTLKAIVDGLEASNLIVEVQCGQFKSSLLAG